MLAGRVLDRIVCKRGRAGLLFDVNGVDEVVFRVACARLGVYWFAARERGKHPIGDKQDEYEPMTAGLFAFV
jgi:hypothetical protein